MTRPPSIVWFERLYLGSLLVSLLTTILFWSRNREVALASAGTQGVAGLIDPIMIGTLVVTVALSLLFWWLVARQRSEVGKWLVVVTEAIGGIFALFALVQLLRGAAVNPTGATLNLLATAMAVAAAVLLFRPDAQGWFRQGSGFVEDARP